MPKPVKKPVRKLKTPAQPKRPTEPNRATHSMLAEHMARAAKQEQFAKLDFATQYKAHMVELGKKGGKISGARRMKNLTTEQRSAIALKAARKRWADVAAKKGGKKK